MCGITGIFDTRHSRNLSREALLRMNRAQWHRGPDEDGLHLEPGVALGHRRLSIIDLATGQQPLSNEDGAVVVVFNGEIYNYQELIPELQALGHVFRTRSDTEVIVHAWEAWGEACVQRLRGMFAFALWDRNRRTLFLARDRLGVKPLHYALLPNGLLLFGSELKSVMAYSGEGGPPSRELDAQAVEDFFTLSYVADPRTIYRSVRKLESGHTLTLVQGQPMPAPKRYWDVAFTLDLKGSQEELGEELLRRLDEAVRIRLVAEVPLGAFLSGGVDSSAVVASMARATSGAVKTCAIGFDDPAFNETEFAQQVAQRYGTDHRVEVVGTEDFALLDTLAQLYDEPYADSSAIPTYRVCQMARRHVTVALSGDGGDEALAGYRRQRLHVNEERVRRLLPLGLRRPLFGWLGQVYPKADWAPRPLRARTTFQALAQDAASAYCHTVSRMRLEHRERLYSPRLKAELQGYRTEALIREHATRAGTDDPLALVQYLDYKTWLPGDANTKVDRASMAHALEVREPLMDHELVQWLARVPSHLKLQQGQGKWLFKKALETRLPQDVLYRPKMGFSVPMAAWLRGPLASQLKSLSGGALAECGLLDMKQTQRLVDQHTSGHHDHAAALWQLLSFDAFLRTAYQGTTTSVDLAA